MTDHVNYVGRVDHPILMDESDQTVMIKGFAGQLTGDVMLFNSVGHNYLDYGITDGSLLLCSNGVEPHDGDLFIKMNQGKPAVYIFRLGSTETAEGSMRVLGNAAEADYVIVSAFNFYH